MATTTKNEPEIFLVKNSGAVDIANMTAVTSVNTVVTVVGMNGETSPLKSGDYIQQISGLDAAAAGWSVVNTVYTSDSTVTMRTTNPSAGPIDPAAIADGTLIFQVFRR